MRLRGDVVCEPEHTSTSLPPWVPIERRQSESDLPWVENFGHGGTVPRANAYTMQPLLTIITVALRALSGCSCNDEIYLKASIVY